MAKQHSNYLRTNISCQNYGSGLHCRCHKNQIKKYKGKQQ